MEFCEKCGGMIVITKGKASCVSCGHKLKGKVKIESSEKIEKANKIAVINEKESSTYPIMNMKCPSCGNKESYFWTMQTRASDESETKFYKCVKCGHSWRVYR